MLSNKDCCLCCCGPQGHGSLEVDEGMIACVAGVLEPPMPFLGGIEGFAGNLPVKKIGFLCFVSITLNTQVFVFFATRCISRRADQDCGVQIVQRCNRNHQVKAIVFPWRLIALPTCSRSRISGLQFAIA